MKIEEAEILIKGGQLNGSRWADLGCGAGTFTCALARLLEPGSLLYAIDRDRQALKQVPDQFGNARIETIAGDIQDASIIPQHLDGILIANALHYVADQLGFIKQLSQHLLPTGTWILVEYDGAKASPWVPRPLSYKEAILLFRKAGFIHARKLAERPSIYGSATIYAAQMTR